MSTALADNDSFFDDWDDGDDGPNHQRQRTAKRAADSPLLKGPYDRGGSAESEPEPEPETEPVAKSKSLTPSTSGNFSAKSSDSAMSSGKRGTGAGRQYDNYSPAPSRSPSPSPYRSSPAYSDSFNSEDSDQDSRHASPEIVPRKASSRGRGGGGRGGGGGGYRAQGTRKGGTSTNSRFNSGTSQDSRSTSKSYGGSASYGSSARNSNKKGFQRTPLKKAPAAGSGNNSAPTKPRSNSNAANTKPRSNSNANHTKPRSNSNVSSIASPRNGGGNEVARRMLSAKGHTISRLRNEFNQLQQEHDELTRENKLLKALQHRQERALSKFDSEESELPQLLKKHSAELDSMRRRIRKYQERDKDKDRRLRDKDDQCLRTEDELKKLRRLAEDKGLLEREELQRRLGRLEDCLAERDQRVGELESHVRHLKKNQRRELKERHARGEQDQEALHGLQAENERLQTQIREKEKELDVRNIYSNRLIKPPSKLRAGTNPSPTAHRPVLLSKATSTQEDGEATTTTPTPTPPRTPHPPPPDSQHRDRSAEEERRRQETASRVKSPKDAPAAAATARESSKETTSRAEPAAEQEPAQEPPPKEEELSEHEKILRDLDVGWSKRSGGGGQQQQQQQEAPDARKRREEEERRRREAEKRKEREEEEERQQRELEEMRRKEEEERRRRQEEDAAKDRQGAQEKPSIYKRPSFFGPKSEAPTSTSHYKPSFFGPGPAASKPTPAAANRGDGDGGDSRAPYRPGFFGDPKPGPAPAAAPLALAKPTQNLPLSSQPSLRAAHSDRSARRLEGDSDDDDEDDVVNLFETKPASLHAPAWMRSETSNSKGFKKDQERKKKAVRRALLSDSDGDEEENVPFFGTKPGSDARKPTPPGGQSPVYAVNSVRDLHKYSRGDSNDTSQQQQQQSNAASTGQNRAGNTNSAEERRKKDLLLARMREIDDGSKPESGRSRKNYNFSQPVENLHNGKPSHPDSSDGGNGGGSGPEAKSKKDTSLTFGSYAPTFGKAAAPSKPKKKSFFVDDDDDDDDDDEDSGADPFAKPKPATTKPKGDLMADLFGGGSKSGESEDKTAARSSFNDDKNVFTSSTKAKPVAAYPWEKKVEVGQGARKPSPAAKASPSIARDSLDEMDDLEEVVL